MCRRVRHRDAGLVCHYRGRQDGDVPDNTFRCRVCAVPIRSSLASRCSHRLWYPQIQFTFKIYDSKTGEQVWKSINLTNFVTPPPGLDKRSSKADQYTVTYKSHPDNPDFPESYTVDANLGQDMQIFMELKRYGTAPGFKVGKGPKGGFSYFGPDQEKPDGYVIHRFWPRTIAEGHFVQNGKTQTIKGSSMFVHAIQGMRPNLVATSWNFGHFQSSIADGVSAIQMEFKTTSQYGKQGAGSGGVSVNVGSVVVDNKLVAVTAQTVWPGEESDGSVVKSKVTHLKAELDPETDYQIPEEISFEWKGASLVPGVSGDVSAGQVVSLGSVAAPKGLIEKVDVLAEIPYVVKMAVNYVAGTKPYIYQVIFSFPACFSDDADGCAVAQPGRAGNQGPGGGLYGAVRGQEGGGMAVQRGDVHICVEI
jgi:hypothetical protein